MLWANDNDFTVTSLAWMDSGNPLPLYIFQPYCRYIPLYINDLSILIYNKDTPYTVHTLHYITLHYITSHYLTLHTYIDYIHT